MIDRVTASRLGIAPTTIDNTLYDAFGQRQISTLYTQLNQYHVVLETAPEWQRNPVEPGIALHPVECVIRRNRRGRGDVVLVVGIGFGGIECTDHLGEIHASSGVLTRAAPACSQDRHRRRAHRRARERLRARRRTRRLPRWAPTAIPLSAFTHGRADHGSALHQSPGAISGGNGFVQPRSECVAGHGDHRHRQGVTKLHRFPASVQADFQGTAASFRNSLSNEALLILAALVTVYIVLGVLYESFIHPITILSTLPSAGVGALLALMIFQPGS